MTKEERDRINRAEEIQRYTENRCEALEKENKTISRKANEAIADKLLITAKYNEVLNDLNQENDKLQKENAELKDYRLTTLAKQQTDMSKYALNLEHKLSWYDDQLTKAKELLKRYVPYRQITDSKVYKDLADETEQFLSEEEKK